MGFLSLPLSAPSVFAAKKPRIIESKTAPETEAFKFINQMKQALLFPGPLRIFMYDYDGNVGPIEGPGAPPIRIFRWQEPSSPFIDPNDLSIPPFIDVPMNNWERGVKNTVPEYRNIPLKSIIGKYIDRGRGIRDEGNSYQDIPIKLDNGITLNTRDYFQDPKESFIFFGNQSAFSNQETDQTLLKSTKEIIENLNFGPMFPLFRITTHPELACATVILTIRPNGDIEWEMSTSEYVKHGHLHAGASIQQVFAITNSSLPGNNTVSTRGYARGDTPPGKMKRIVLDYFIENVLKRRIDSTNQNTPGANVLTYIEDNLGFVSEAQNLFEEKIRGVQHTLNNELGTPPLKLILANTAPLQTYQLPPMALNANPEALYQDTDHLSTLSVFDSKFISRGLPLRQTTNYRSYQEIMISILMNAFEVDRKIAKNVLLNSLPCSALLGGKK